MHFSNSYKIAGIPIKEEKKKLKKKKRKKEHRYEKRKCDSTPLLKRITIRRAFDSSKRYSDATGRCGLVTPSFTLVKGTSEL